jgi:predicted phage tail protein
VLDTSSSLWDAVNVACQVGRGAIIIRGTKYFAYYDAPGVPTQLFSVANIVPDSFKESYLPVKDRATELEIQYADKENNYERSSLNVMTDEGFAGTGLQQKTTISMLGCVTTTQAYREARYRLLMNQYLIRTISYDVGIDSLACEVGDLIYVQHDIPSWGLGGRIESATINTVTLDQSIVLEEGKSYRLMVRHTNDMLSQRTVVVPGGGYTGDTVTVTADFPHEPSQYDIYVFGEVDKDRKVFRLVSVRRSKDFDFTLTALEYDERVYAEQIAPTPPPPGDPYAVPPYVTEISTSYRWYADPTDPVVPPPVDPGTGGGNGGNGGTNDNADSTDGTGTGSQGGSGGDGSTGGDTGGDTGQ